jgi:2-oxoglutarate dehydrogenase E2 component (dihydrolipoamide succinyltransferase)
LTGTGKNGRIIKQDVERYIDENSAPPASVKESSHEMVPVAKQQEEVSGERLERRVPMTRLRARIAERLVQSQQEAAILTTFNEVNMKPVMELRTRYKDAFEKQHGVRLGFMSFFVQASVEALKRFPEINASVDGNDIVYHGFYDVGVAVSGPNGLVVPIIRDADIQSISDIEKSIIDYANKARENSLTIEDITGGTFTISNGGVFGSMLSTPIINPPQSAILGMHSITERAMVVDGEVTVLPMMYLALSYDHRLVDGKSAVQFLVTIKQLLEDPSRMLLGV